MRACSTARRLGCICANWRRPIHAAAAAGRQSSANNALVSCSVPWTARRSSSDHGMRRCDTHRFMHKGRARCIHRVTRRRRRGSLEPLETHASSSSACNRAAIVGDNQRDPSSRFGLRQSRRSCRAMIAEPSAHASAQTLRCPPSQRRWLTALCCRHGPMHCSRPRAIVSGSSRHITLAAWPC